ncbi:hypothetical protein [Otoolea muris]|uniref:hypothetical protein n=1 Tax=Otoolea muris TaxID=2941515 RepID=UPI00203C3002|nr:hypothetical protein [Otoolea muris]
MINLKMNQAININDNTGREERLKQMKGRILLSAAADSSDYHFSREWRDSGISQSLSGIRPGREYQSAMTLMGLRNPKEFLEAITGSVSLGKDADTVGAAVRIMHNLEQHKRNLNEIQLLPKKCMKKSCMEAYVTAFAGALDAGAEEIFLSLDGKRLAHALKEKSYEVYHLFQMLPFFERTDYVFDVMEKRRINTVFSHIIPSAMSVEEKQMLGSRTFLASRILTTINPGLINDAISVCAANQEAFVFLRYLAQTTSFWSWNDAINGTKNLTDAKPCIQALECLKGFPEQQTQTFHLMNDAWYDKKFINILCKKIQNSPEKYLSATERLSSCMMAAWVLGRDDILAFQGASWWGKRLEETVLHAMLHKWNRFLSGLADDRKLQDAAAYLGTKCSQIDANLLSGRQMIRICEQEMLSENTVIPEWMKPATYDQILAFHEIRKIPNIGYRDTLTRIFQELSGNLKPETAGKRMFQFVQARSSSAIKMKIGPQEEEEITRCLQKHDLYAWSAQVYAFRPTHALSAMTLPYIRSTQAFSEAETEEEAWFVLRNLELCKDGLESAKEIFCQTDTEVLGLKKKFRFDDSFYQKYKKECTDFFLRSTEIAYTYADCLGKTELGKFRLIVKAAMCGKLSELKYHDGDLTSEIGFPVSQETTKAWIRDLDISCEDKFSGACMEDSSFNGIMSIGSRPLYTCMNYRDGMYKHCLISYFDANKKILYRMDGNGQTLARAVLRFTKATSADIKNGRNRLDFVDVEDTAESTAENSAFQILFLERMYSGYQGKDKKILAESLLKAAMMKADEMGARLVLAEDYAGVMDAGRDAFTPTRLSIYITKSKSSSQYLDSFGGVKTYDRGEDSYMKVKCLIHA